MKTTISKRLGLPILFAVVLLASGCIVRPGKLRTESRTVELGGAESARVRVEIGAGELALGRGSGALMDVQYTYNVTRWEPEVEYSVQGTQGNLVIRQPAVENVRGLVGDYRYEWDVRLNENVPIDLSVAMGAGQSRLNVGQLNLTSLSAEIGAGECLLDLTGARDQDLEVSVQGGVGQLTVVLPKNVGARVQVAGGLGSVNATGLQREGDAYINDAYGRSEATIQVDIEGGIGEVNLESGG